MPSVVASITLPKVRIAAGASRTFGPHAVPDTPISGLRIVVPRSTTKGEKLGRRDDSEQSIVHIDVQGRTGAGQPWQSLGSFTTVGGARRVRTYPELRALRKMPEAERRAFAGGKSQAELRALLKDQLDDQEDDEFTSSFPATTLRHLRAVVAVAGDRFAGSATIELIGP